MGSSERTPAASSSRARASEPRRSPSSVAERRSPSPRETPCGSAASSRAVSRTNAACRAAAAVGSAYAATCVAFDAATGVVLDVAAKETEAGDARTEVAAARSRAVAATSASRTPGSASGDPGARAGRETDPNAAASDELLSSSFRLVSILAACISSRARSPGGGADEDATTCSASPSRNPATSRSFSASEGNTRPRKMSRCRSAGTPDAEATRAFTAAMEA